MEFVIGQVKIELSPELCETLRVYIQSGDRPEWSEISFKSKFSKSKSASNTAAIHLNANSGICIYFGFHNDSIDIDTGMQGYDGYNILTMEDNNHISAKYFNDRPNPNKRVKGGNKGIFELTRELDK
ncbi:hypothetical protein RO787_18780 [Blautia coccoides]|uniref:Cap15 family cyclic dinucleotide receptor domain-containing protein n=1 Tax=Blautia producta TaxID=33035 RepID=UPI0028A4E26E|nr:hypothetical protein [Blautia coccoides]MDT4375386.1 hypothetical protein [Blautia coccoides]